VSISATPSAAPVIDEVILDAYKKAAIVPIDFGIGSDVQWAAKAAHGRRTLNRVLNAASTERFFEYFVNIDILELTADEHQYTLDADILNIVDDGSYIPASNDPEEEETTGETPVKPISAYRWNQLSAKSSKGTPVHYFIERNADQLLMRLWPVPSEAGKIRFRTHRIPGSSSSGGNNPDFKRHWEQWAVLALAYEFMTDGSMPLEERQLMRADRDVAFEKLKAYDTNNTPPEVVFAHTTPWGGRYC
jgi:hypothetical protein